MKRQAKKYFLIILGIFLFCELVKGFEFWVIKTNVLSLLLVTVLTKLQKGQKKTENAL